MTDSRTDRRGLLARVAGALAVGLAGCSGPSAYNEEETSSPTSTPTSSPTPSPTDSPTASPTPEPSPTETRTTGASANGSQPVGNGTAAPRRNRTNGNRTRNGSVGGSPTNRTGNATAPGNRTGNATATGNRTGNASGPGNRTGNATASPTGPRRNRTGNGSTGNRTLTPRPTRIAVRVRYPGAWAGSVETDVDARTVSGFGRETIPVEGDPSIVLADVTKRERSRKRLVVQILKNGRVVARASTRKPNGNVQVTHTL